MAGQVIFFIRPGPGFTRISEEPMRHPQRQLFVVAALAVSTLLPASTRGGSSGKHGDQGIYARRGHSGGCGGQCSRHSANHSSRGGG